MNRSDFLKEISARGPQSIEIVNGIIVVHTGRKIKIFDMQKNNYEQEILEMYDAYGNRFYGNYPSKEIAKKIVAQLKEEGKDAVIGPKAPGRVPEEPIGEVVGVYIVGRKKVEEDREPAE